MTAEIVPMPAPEPSRLNDVVLSNLRAEFGRRRLSARRAAQLLGMSQTAMSDRLIGRTRVNLDDLQRFCELLGIEPEDLMVRPQTTAGPVSVDEPRGVVRHRGLEPRTRWFGVSDLSAYRARRGWVLAA